MEKSSSQKCSPQTTKVRFLQVRIHENQSVELALRACSETLRRRGVFTPSTRAYATTHLRRRTCHRAPLQCASADCTLTKLHP